ncbi:MAG: LuxR C-terminal-related transcriptional regulator [Dysgonamonadaceae bacterium]|jgi:DNA-binding NarL/FixJ family response regulator|nr:LuxR C-terminal-related transcriptional regulator [Dysgonamonadaceae bacterium]
MGNTNRNRIVIIEPSPVIRLGMKKMIEENALFTVTGVYNDIPSFKRAKGDKSVDIILVNPTIVNAHKPFAIKDLFSDYPHAIIAAIHYGYVDSETLTGLDGVLNIYDDSAGMAKKLRRMIKMFVHNEEKPDNIDLSDREKEVLVSIAKGLTNKEIADDHFISIHTVISHRRNITKKTGIKTVAGLTLYATFNNLISQEDL